MSKPLPDRLTHLEAVLPRIESLVERSATQIAEVTKLVLETSQIARTALDRTVHLEAMQVAAAKSSEQLAHTQTAVVEIRRDLQETRRSVDSLTRKGVWLATMITVFGAVGSFLLNSVSFYPKNKAPETQSAQP